MKLKAWQRERRRQDARRATPLDPRFVVSVDRFLTSLRCLREARRCGCLPPGRFTGRDFFGVPL